MDGLPPKKPPSGPPSQRMSFSIPRKKSVSSMNPSQPIPRRASLPLPSTSSASRPLGVGGGRPTAAFGSTKFPPIPRRPSPSGSSVGQVRAKTVKAMSASVPRKSFMSGPPGSLSRKHGKSSSSNKRRRSLSPTLPKLVSIKSEHPFVLKVQVKGFVRPTSNVTATKVIPPTTVRASKRAPKKSKNYTEPSETDSDDFLTDSEDDDDKEVTTAQKKTSRLKKVLAAAVAGNSSSSGGGGRSSVNASSQSKSPDVESFVAASSGIPSSSGSAGGDAMMTMNVEDATTQVEAPPPGVLANLWYSRENVLHIWVIEKVIAWKMRPIRKLEWKDPNATKCLDSTEAIAISSKLLVSEAATRDAAKRMEISRINPSQCPVVMTVAAEREARRTSSEMEVEQDGQLTIAPEPKFVLAPTAKDEKEEVLLVKWRGKSYLHCSWERQRDLNKFDPTHSTARNKVKRFHQTQEIAYGKNWRHVLETERGGGSSCDDTTQSEEELFPSQYTEVERILACDEREMNMKVFAKQRALNIRDDLTDLEKRNKEEHVKTKGPLEDLPKITTLDDEPWDPEDYVRYIVKWKGLQYSELYWEYWKDIKRDAVEQAEDFWYRQQAPSMEQVLIIKSRPHPHIRDFRKLTESPEFGVSKRARPIADLAGSNGASLKNEEDEKVAFRLRSYQLEGVNWLLFNWWNRRSCILADEMGLGKTIQSVSFLQQLHSLPATQVRGPFLIVAPLSLIGQWESESHTWAPDMIVVFYHGSADARDFLVQQEFYYTDQFIPKPNAMKLKKQHITKFHILITTYEVVLKDIAVLSRIKWKALVVDEAHRLKNPKGKLFEEMATIPRDFCLLLTGTPLQNSTEELWALLHFSDPIAFKSKEEFIDKFGELQDAKQVSDLHAVLKPYLLRRVKEDVEKSLPPKQETILEVTLTPIQKQYYKAIYERNTAFLFKGAKPSNAPSLMNVMMELRKACNHPFLIRGAEERIVGEAAAAALKSPSQESKSSLSYLQVFCEQLVKSSGKFVLMAKLLPKLFDGGHKVLIFSQMVRALDLLEELLKHMKYRYERLDGSTAASSRTAAVDRFNRKSCQRFVMLLSTRAGGLGLNLTSADTVIIFDSDWNPQNDLQAMARVHRIGQTRAVRVYRLLTSKTYEVHLFHSASMKLGLDRAVLAHQRQQDGDDGSNGKPKGKVEKEAQAKEIDELLKKGAYDVFNDDDDEEAKKFMETDIDALLEKSAKNVTYDKTSASSLSSGLGSFSKASFVAETEEGGKDVDLDDPDFWEKAVGLDAPVDTPEEIENMIDDGVKRVRKQVQQFDPYAAFHEAEQKKKDKIEKKLKEEKEEKERLRLEKKLKKLEEKEKKKREREAERRAFLNQKEQQKAERAAKVVKVEPPPKEPKTKKPKKSTKSRLARLVEFEDPVYERLRQAWEEPQRNRASSAVLRFGFGRFCKIRHESNLTSLPLQDMEVFARSYIYQVSLQAGVAFLSLTKEKFERDGHSFDIRSLIRMWLGPSTTLAEMNWISQAVATAMQMQVEVENHRKLVRIPLSLVESVYMKELRKGCALRALRRIGVLNRLNLIFEEGIEETLEALGFEERGRRGCITKELDNLDDDLKARHLSTEELLLAVSHRLADVEAVDVSASWWNRACDVGLLVGTFVHGFGNYEAMRSDPELPFSKLVEECGLSDKECKTACARFLLCSNASCKVFDEALDSSKFKSQKEAHAAVAAAVANSKKSEEERAAGNDDVYCIDRDQDDSHLVTLTRLAKSMRKTIGASIDAKSVVPHGDQTTKKKGKPKRDGSGDDYNRSRHLLPLPDARVLDHRLVSLINAMESDETLEPEDVPSWSETDDGNVHSTLLSQSLLDFGVSSHFSPGIGLCGNQCGTEHRSLDDGSDFCVGPATFDLSQVSYGNDSPRYLRAIGCPINFTRYAVLALVWAEEVVLMRMLEQEKHRNTKLKQKRTCPAVAKSNGTTLDAGETVMKAESMPNDDGKIVKGDAVLPSTATSAQKDETQESPKKLDTIDQTHLVPEPFRSKAQLRAALCVTALHYGYCNHSNNDFSIDPLIQTKWRCRDAMFSVSAFQSCAQNQAIDFPSELKEVKEYIELWLLPHCLRLAVSGNGPTTRSSRGSKGKYATPYGISLYQEPNETLLNPLPDPTKEPSEHSMEAVERASVILRRSRMLCSSQWIIDGRDESDILELLLEVSNHSKTGLPLWWTAEHDVGLLVSVATRGVLSLMIKENRLNTPFDPVRIHESLKAQTTGIADTVRTNWIRYHSNQFPSMFSLERRLGVLCGEATKMLPTEHVHRYHHLPMFDHQAWPRK